MMCATMSAITTINGTPNNQRIIGILFSLSFSKLRFQ